MPQELPGFKGLVLSYIKENAEEYNLNDDGFVVERIGYDAKLAVWNITLDVVGDIDLRHHQIDAEDFMGFMWNKISMMCGEQ